jgi:hypothetical protein
VGSFRTIGSRCNSLFNPQPDNFAEGGRRLPGAVPEIRNPQFIWHPSSCLFLPFSDHKSSIGGVRLGAECPPIYGPCCMNRDGILCARDAPKSRNSLRPME